MTRSTVGLCGLHLIGNAALLYLGYVWLGMQESDASHLAASVFVVLAFALGALWLHGLSFVYFRSADARFGRAAAQSARNLLPLLILAIVAAILYGLLTWWRNSFGHEAFVIGSYGTLKLRKPVPPSSVERVFRGLVWALRWIVLPAILFPLGANAAVRGWRGIRWHALKPGRAVLYSIEVCGLLLCAVWVPLRLIHWIPKLSNFKAEAASVTARIGAGYLLFVIGLLLLEFITSAGSPRETHPSTVAAP